MSTTDVMLDDIKFEYCAEGDVPEGSDQLSCDFEENTCSWYHDYTASMLWEEGIGQQEFILFQFHLFLLIISLNNLRIMLYL